MHWDSSYSLRLQSDKGLESGLEFAPVDLVSPAVPNIKYLDLHELLATMKSTFN
jgi:hypothetical protein